MGTSCMTLSIRNTVVLILTLISGEVFCQEMGQREADRGFGQEIIQRERTGNQIIFFELHYILTDSALHKVEALYRVRRDFFTFLRNVQENKETFKANADASVEILDSAGNSVTRQIKEIELESESNAAQELKREYLQGTMSFHLPSGKYTVLFTIEDKESKRVMPDVRRPLEIPLPKKDNYSPLIPIMAEQQNDNGFHSFNINGDVEFSKNFGFLFVSPIDKFTTASYSVKRLSSDDEGQITVIDTVVQCKIFPSSSLSTIEKEGEIYFVVEPAPRSIVYYIPVNGITLKQGRYEIDVTFADSVKTTGFFAARWLDMPAVLNNLDLSIYPMQHILTKDDYSELNSGSRSSRIEKFEKFWKKKDPTPETAYNEVMAEFYRRVDYSIGAFRTLKETNGSLTDRGKIYILYGKPTSIERSLEPGRSPREVWKYGNVQKTFVFEDRSKQGNYKLAESK